MLFTSLTVQNTLVNGSLSLVSVTNFYPVIELPMNPGTTFKNIGFFCYYMQMMSVSLFLNFCQHFSNWHCYWSTGICLRSHRPDRLHYLLEKVCHCQWWNVTKFIYSITVPEYLHFMQLCTSTSPHLRWKYCTSTPLNLSERFMY